MNWDKYFFILVNTIKGKSKDPSTKVGCVIATRDNQILATGFNGFPRGVGEEDASRWERPLKYDYVEHAERNAVYHAARHGVSLRGAVCYLNWFPCKDCAKAIIQSGIGEIVVENIPDDVENGWGFCIANTMLREAGVGVREYDV